MFQLKFKNTRGRKLISVTLSLALYIIMFPIVSSGPRVTAQSQANAGTVPDSIVTIAPGSAYRQTNLVTDSAGLAPVLDPLLVNPWGISQTSSSPFWVANNGTGTSQLIRGDVGGAPVVLNTSPQTINITGSLPTGTVSNPTSTDFVLPGPCASAPCGANFLFSSITGNITGWDPNAPAANSTTAVIAVSQPGHVYTGLALANNGSGNFLYAANFAAAQPTEAPSPGPSPIPDWPIEVYNSSFVRQQPFNFPFSDPTLPADYAAYNVQNLGGSIYVTYAKVGTGGHAEAGVGNGFVRRFNTNGVRDLTFGINNGSLNAPWGLAIAPASFGIFGGALLVGNFGEGNPSIHAFNVTTGAFLGTLQDESSNGIEIDGLWGLQFGNGGNGGDPNTLYFAAGIGHESHGLFGKLQPTTASATSLIQFGTDDYAIGEGSGHIDITVTRAGDVSGSATINYATFDAPEPGHASQKSDYEIAAGTVHFAAGETSKTFRLLIVDDNFVEEEGERLDLYLSNPTGTGVGLGTPNQSTVSILEDDSVAPTTNRIDEAQFFVRQHYLDFLNREPDTAGLAFWTNQITACGTDAVCTEVKRIHVSAAFFLSIEFQRTGYLAYLTHRTAFGPVASGGGPVPVLYGNFMRDAQALQRDFVFGAPGADAQLETNKQAYFNEFVTRPEFVSKYPSTQTNAQYVDNLLASANLTPSEVRFFSVNLTNVQENPPTTPTTTTGAARPASSGTAKLQFNSAQTAMTMNVTVNNIDFTASQTADTNDNLTAAHIHAGGTVTPATNGPAVWGFFGGPFNDNNPNDQLVTPFTSCVGGTIKGKWDAPEGNGTTLAAQLTNLREGRAYFNFHTSQFGGGEIRGNFPAATAFRDSLVAGLNGSTLTRAQVLRLIAEAEELQTREFNNAFVAMEYFGYLRRDPDTEGYSFWLDKLNAFNGDFIAAEMVKAFISSSEYRQRFGPS